MIVVFDASVLIFLFDPQAAAPVDERTGAPVSECKNRITHLIAELQKNKAKIIIPTPSLAEIMVYDDIGASERLRLLNASKHFRLTSFDERAAVEFAALERDRRARLPKTAQVIHRKAKFDEQIVAIARVERADIIYSDDKDIRKLVGAAMTVIGVADLPLPPVRDQLSMQFKTPDEVPEEE